MNQPCTLIIFGATGNLAKNKLLPALYHLEDAGRLPEGLTIVGFGRRDWDHEHWREEVKAMVSPKARGGLNEQVHQRFQQRLFYFQGDLTEEAAYHRLAKMLDSDPIFAPNLMFYMAIRLR